MAAASVAFEFVEGEGLQAIFTKPNGERFVVRWRDFKAALEFMGQFSEGCHAAWPTESKLSEDAWDKEAFVRVILSAVQVRRPVPCMKGHLHALPSDARACEADPKIPPMVGADFVGPLKH